MYSATDPRVDPGPASVRATASYSQGYQRLKFSRREAESILAFVPPGLGRSMLDFEAGKDAVLAGALKGHRIVHFATHGILDPSQPELSGLVLSLVDENGHEKDGFLHAHELYNLDLPAELVVLSACQTALGKQIRGEGVAGLARGFMYAGAPRVVVSLWNLRDRSTPQLMRTFYRGLLVEGLPPAKALRQAQIEMWKEGPSPYRWAAFVLQGDWKSQERDLD